MWGNLPAGTVAGAPAGFFAKAGFHPPELWVYIAAIAETAAGVALVLGICTRFAALGACALLAIAVYSLQVVKGFGWTWNTGGYEYPVFWAIVSLSVAIEAWKAQLARVPSATISHLKVWAWSTRKQGSPERRALACPPRFSRATRFTRYL